MRDSIYEELSPRRNTASGTCRAWRLLAQDETHFTEILREQRLLLARRLLLDPRNLSRKISDIAHSAGFSDVSYFNREFRRRFGMRPTDRRRDWGIRAAHSAAEAALHAIAPQRASL